jgi:hypothetical protein
VTARRAARWLVLLTLGAAPGAAGAREFELGLVAGAQQTGGIATSVGSLSLDAGPLYGLRFAWRVRPDGLIEGSWAREVARAHGELESGPARFDVTFDALEIGGLWETRPGRMRPFLGLSLGTTRVAGPGQGAGGGWNLSGSISGGVRWLLGDHATAHVEVRGAGILFTEGGALGCQADGGGTCSLAVSGSQMGLLSVRAGLATRF